MKPKTIAFFFSFGTELRYLQDANQTYQIHGKDHVLEVIKRFFERLDFYNLSTTKKTKGFSDLKKFFEQMEKKDSNSKLSPEEAKKLRDTILKIRETLNAESKNKFAYIVEDKRIDIEKLLNNVSGLFAKDIYDSIPEIAKYDFTEAGRCIAFEVPTAAAFHILRGTESVLRQYYCSIVKKNRCSPLLWGKMINGLELRKRNRPSKTLLDNLKNIKDNFRNPTDHPEKRYDIDEVQDLFPLCIDVVNRMNKKH
jgi:hypothetical protein